MLATQTAREFLAELGTGGWLPGPPPGFPAACLLADRACYGRLVCTLCGHGRHDVAPYHRGRAYLLVCTCKSCGHAVEM